MIRLVVFFVAVPVTFGQVTAIRIGQHQIRETLQEWSGLETSTNPQTTQTELSPHRIDEGFADWLKINRMDLDDICGKHKRSDTTMDFKAVCKRLTATRETGAGDFYTTNQYNRTFGFRFKDGTLAAYTSDGGSTWHTSEDREVDLHCNIASEDRSSRCTTGNNRAYTWKFLNGRLSEVLVSPDWMAIYKQYSEEGIARHPEVVPAFQDEVEFLTQTYGKPSHLEKVPYQNSFGAHWERLRVVWTAPDETQITAFERTEFNHQGQLELVTFTSKEALENSSEAKPNPYRH
jgi:hypothetical protein